MDSQKSSSCALATVGTSCVDNNHTVHFTAAGCMLLCGKKQYFFFIAFASSKTLDWHFLAPLPLLRKNHSSQNKSLK